LTILTAKNSGFCFGVKRAVETVEACIAEKDGAIYTYGEIIHNQNVVEDFKARGVLPVTRIEDVPAGAMLVIRSHGVSPAIYQACIENGIYIKDATCPFVKRIHHIVAEARKRDMQVIIIGKHDHPEVIGINGWCDNSAIILAEESECDALPYMENVCVVVQTTMPLEKFNSIVERVRVKSKNIEIYNTICNTTAIRQKEAADLASQCDCVVVIGGRNSSIHKSWLKYAQNCANIQLISKIRPNFLLKKCILML
jgi:4-hydroxy-3-methylbut-2-enyl diphosphate reductase